MKLKKSRIKFKLKKLTYAFPRTLLFITALVLLTLSLVVFQNRKNIFKSRAEETESESSIVGGYNADPANWPFVAKIRIETTRLTGIPASAAPYCTGSLINEQWVISAAHCFINQGKALDPNILAISFIENNNQTLYTSSYPIQFPESNLAAMAARGANLPDIALIKLSQKVSFTPVSIPLEKAIIPSQSTLFAAGWGVYKVEPNGWFSAQFLYPDILQELDFENHDDISAHSAVKFISISKTGSLCGGDSGGPMVYRDTAASKVFLVGVHSGASNCSASASNFDTNIIKNAKWIKETSSQIDVDYDVDAKDR